MNRAGSLAKRLGRGLGVPRVASGATASDFGTDADFAHVKMLIQPTTADTTIYDVTGKAITNIGGVTLSTETPFAGLKSLYFDGVDDYLSLLDSDDWTLGTDACLEAMVRFDGAPSGNPPIFFHGDAANNYDIVWYPDGSSIMNYTSNNAGSVAVNIAATLAAPTNVWTHLRLSKSGTTYRHFINGIAAGSTVDTDAITNKAGSLLVGAFFGGAAPLLKCWMTMIRITNGAARSTAAFSPLTAPFPTRGP